MQNKENFITFTEITNEKELSYKYNGKSYIKYPISSNRGVLTVSNDNLNGFVIVSKRGLRSQIKGLQRASIKKVREVSDEYVNKYIKILNNK